MVVFALPFSDGPRGQFRVFGQADRDHLNPHDYGRVFFDLSFWLVINTIMMSLVLGIIIDTFSQLRAERAKQKAAVRNSCVICGLPVRTSTRAPSRLSLPSLNHHRVC